MELTSTSDEQLPVVSGWQRRRQHIVREWHKTKYLWLLFLPCLIYFLIFRYAPMFGLVITFKNYNLFKGIMASDWVGFKYYTMFLQNPDFFLLMRNTFLLGIYKLVFGFPAPILLALLLNELKSAVFKRFVQTVSYLPHFISNVIVASMVIMFLSPTSGLINQIIKMFGFEAVNFMMEPGLFRPIYVLSEIWQHLGWETIIYLAALTAVDPQLYEAADMDGANRWQKMKSVTLPGIAPAIVIVFILNVGKVLEIGFEKVFLMYNAAVYETADVIGTYVYRVGLVQGNFSYAAAIDLFMGIISLIFIVSANWVSRKVSENSLW
ncbi:putative aldouronate transport system permease protein [Paenibacillus sp. UNCCL117]|uniref:ABC transporter permease n=1 Tax=unclassified Paenibacillus TaxID=185978 RepID=UPI000890154E|nr:MULTISPECIES: ABC transporter permease subunit [unclassified Paenibacillus]SDD79778.1 putative aldouronate transport system permease protein [Paenibacillus sp. cl123]SFW53278.1 putative aldouronate transport system permease protein [Paenibacillus sp. UNCCL117]